MYNGLQFEVKLYYLYLILPHIYTYAHTYTYTHTYIYKFTYISVMVIYYMEVLITVLGDRSVFTVYLEQI